MRTVQMGFYYYSFILNGRERIFYTYCGLDKDEILRWAENYHFIEKEDFVHCKDMRELSEKEVKERNKELYRKWWNKREERRLKGEDVSCDLIPPTIGEGQLN